MCFTSGTGLRQDKCVPKWYRGSGSIAWPRCGDSWFAAKAHLRSLVDFQQGKHHDFSCVLSTLFFFCIHLMFSRAIFAKKRCGLKVTNGMPKKIFWKWLAETHLLNVRSMPVAPHRLQWAFYILYFVIGESLCLWLFMQLWRTAFEKFGNYRFLFSKTIRHFQCDYHIARVLVYY